MTEWQQGVILRYLSDKIMTVYIRGAKIFFKKPSSNLIVTGARRLT
jgi:hypothetical protein